MLFPMNRHSRVHVVMLNAMRSLSLNLMEKLVIFMLDITHDSRSLIFLWIIVLIAMSAILLIESTMFVEVALDLAAMVGTLAVLLIMVRRRSHLPMVKHVLLTGPIRLKEGQVVALIFDPIDVWSHLSERPVLMVHDFFTLEASVVIDMILPAMLVGPEQLLVGRLITIEADTGILTTQVSFDLQRSLLNAMAIVNDLMVGHFASLHESGLKIDMIMLIGRLIKMPQLGNTFDGKVLLDACHFDFGVMSLFCHTMLEALFVLVIGRSV